MENETSLITLPEPEEVRHQIEAINKFQRVVHSSLIEGMDYGIIPGTSQPTLLKPGAEKVTKLLGLSDTYEILDKQEDWSKPFFRYLIKCTLTSIKYGSVISEGMGECNSYESKYRYRDAKKKCPVCGEETIIKGKEQYGGGWLCWEKKGGCGTKFPDGSEEIEKQPSGKVENEDIYSLVNTLLKMAEKRSLIDAALHAGRLSDVFTQDMEDISSIVNEKPAVKPERKSTEKTATPNTHKQQASTPETATTRELESIKTIGDLYKACNADFKMQPADVLKEAGYSNQNEITEKPSDIYQRIRDVKGRN